jgi:hypothetical protein
MNNPLSVDRYIKLITEDELDIDAIKKWFQCIVKYAPSGTLKTISIDDKPKGVSLIHQSDGRHSYLVPLTRDLSDSEVGKIVKKFAKLNLVDSFDVETNETRLSAGDDAGISIDASKHLALCTTLAKQKHEDWVRERTGAGWRYGTTFDADEKTHPLLRPWDQIPDRYKQPDMEWPQKLVSILNDQGYAIIPQVELQKLLRDLRG